MAAKAELNDTDLGRLREGLSRALGLDEMPDNEVLVTAVREAKPGDRFIRRATGTSWHRVRTSVVQPRPWVEFNVFGTFKRTQKSAEAAGLVKLPPTNPRGDVACPWDGEMVNIACWQCGWKRSADPAPATPTLDRLSAAKTQAKAVFDFLEWLESEGIVLANYAEVGGYRDEQLVPVPKPGRSLMFEWLGLDENAMEDERRAVLAHHVALTSEVES